ncbi:MAG: glycosyltransferase family 2 protein [Clostridia bacterium]|nr:glycosyltransferase family 2 protein [Clostridia bacterium]
MWYEILYRVLSIINYVILVIVALPLLMEIFEIVFALCCKKKTYPKSDKKAKIAFIIPAHNEADVIFDTVKDALASQDYPKELFDVYVVAHNCTDNTADLAREAGAKVLVLDDPDPSHRMALYPIKHGIDYVLKNDPEVEMFIHLDADNHMNKEFSSLMNDAYQSGVDFARPYEGAINGPQNFFTRACAIFYAIDSRFLARARERLHLAAHINGSGAMMSRKLLLETGGYDCNSISDDTEFCFNRILEGRKGHFVEDAVVFEDLPSSGKDTAGRNKRIIDGNKKLFKTKLVKMIPAFFKTGNFSFVETFFTYIWLYISPIVFTWLPLYYIYFFTFGHFASIGALDLTIYTPEYFSTIIWVSVALFVAVFGIAIILFGVVSSFVIAFHDYKKYGAKNRRELMNLTYLFLAYMIFYAFSLMFGGMTKKKKWQKVTRNTVKNGK